MRERESEGSRSEGCKSIDDMTPHNDTFHVNGPHADSLSEGWTIFKTYDS